MRYLLRPQICTPSRPSSQLAILDEGLEAVREASVGAGETNVPGWTCTGPTHPAIDPRVGREPGGAGTLRGSPKPVVPQSCGHGRLSSRTLWGERRRQRPGSFSERSPRLDPDEWLVRPQADTYFYDSPASPPSHSPWKTLRVSHRLTASTTSSLGLTSL
jgi:hypothetical protein